MKKYILVCLLALFMLPTFSSCVSSPHTAWTPKVYKKKDFTPRHRQKPAKFGFKRLMWRDI